jgi:hypothetical protein
MVNGLIARRQFAGEEFFRSPSIRSANRPLEGVGKSPICRSLRMAPGVVR